MHDQITNTQAKVWIATIFSFYFRWLFLLAEFEFRDYIIYIWIIFFCIEFVLPNMSVPTIFWFI